MSTATSAPTPTAEASNAQLSTMVGCPSLPDPTQPQFTMVGSLKVSIPRFSPAHNYPETLVPNDAPKAPYKVPLTSSEVENSTWHPHPLVNPSLAYEIEVCNTTSAGHTLSHLGMSITTFTPSSGPYTVWHICGGGTYDAATKTTTPGCGGGLGGPGVDFLTATFGKDAAGATSPATASADYGGPNLPLSIAPGRSVLLFVNMKGLASQGTYTMSMALGVDGATPRAVQPSDSSFIIATSPTIWTGTACENSPTMMAQIPPSAKGTYYVCPPQS